MIKTKFKKTDCLNRYDTRKIAHNIAIELLCDITNINLDKVSILYKDEKPIFNIANWFLSISYCKGLVCVAISDKEIGIDCEISRHFSNIFIKYIFNKNEIKMVNEGIIKYIDLWCMKEAYAKLINANNLKSINYKNIEIQYNNGYNTINKEVLTKFINISFENWTIWIAQQAI